MVADRRLQGTVYQETTHVIKEPSREHLHMSLSDTIFVKAVGV